MGNSGDDPIEVEVTFLLGGGGTQIEIYEVPALSRFTADVNAAVGAGQGGPVNKSYSVPANGRTTVYVNGPEGVGSNKNVSVHLSSTNYFLAERPMYFNFGGVWTGGHDVVGYTP